MMGLTVGVGVGLCDGKVVELADSENDVLGNVLGKTDEEGDTELDAVTKRIMRRAEMRLIFKSFE